ncbi:MAG: hypothetical protein GX801_01745 [Fibrobacter sp.]|nr:hypothetical protein [Fibrobacter sp.]
MKKILFLFILVMFTQPIFAQRYPIEDEFELMMLCVEGSNKHKFRSERQLIDFCACSIEEAQKRVSHSQFKRELRSRKGKRGGNSFEEHFQRAERKCRRR